MLGWCGEEAVERWMDDGEEDQAHAAQNKREERRGQARQDTPGSLTAEGNRALEHPRAAWTGALDYSGLLAGGWHDGLELRC